MRKLFYGFTTLYVALMAVYMLGMFVEFPVWYTRGPFTIVFHINYGWLPVSEEWLRGSEEWLAWIINDAPLLGRYNAPWWQWVMPNP